MIKDVLITPLSIINVEGGSVMHAMKDSDSGFSGFGEAYFSNIGSGCVKAWKRHKNMTLNIVVPEGEIIFVLFDDRGENGQFQEVILSKSNYHRLTIPPMIWVGFQGVYRDNSILLNIADIKHEPDEIDRKPIEDIQYKWRNLE